MTNLTIESRKQTIESVIAKGTFLAEEKAAIKKSTADAIRKALLATLPAGFHDAIKTLPVEWFRKCGSVELECEYNPIALQDRQKYKSTKYPGSWRSAYVSIEFDSFLVPDSFDNRYGRMTLGRIFAEQHLVAQIDAAKKLAAKETALRDELSAFLNSCKTYRQVLEKMPELEPHLPPAPKKSLPLVVNTAPLAAKLANLGFDRSLPKE